MPEIKFSFEMGRLFSVADRNFLKKVIKKFFFAYIHQLFKLEKSSISFFTFKKKDISFFW